MQQLLAEFLETVNLGVLRDGQVFYVEMLESPHTFRMAARIGMRASIHSTALGKAIAAFLPKDEVAGLTKVHGLPALTSRTITTSTLWKRELARIRSKGYSEDDEETEAGASCLGAPIFRGPGGEVVGALSISGPSSRVRAMKNRAVRALVRACEATSRALGYRGASVGQRG
jgi:IclR family acetate operon transcriptional repressor